MIFCVSGSIQGVTNVFMMNSMYQHKVDVDMLNTVKSMLADVSSVSPSSEQTVFALCSDKGLNAQNISQHTLYSIQHIHINLTLINTLHVLLPCRCRPKLVLRGTSIPSYLSMSLSFVMKDQCNVGETGDTCHSPCPDKFSSVHLE